MTIDQQKLRDAVSYEQLRDEMLADPAARGDGNADSDLDFVVRFATTASLFDRGGMWTELHDLLGRDIDLVNEALLRDEVREEVLNDAVVHALLELVNAGAVKVDVVGDVDNLADKQLRFSVE